MAESPIKKYNELADNIKLVNIATTSTTNGVTIRYPQDISWALIYIDINGRCAFIYRSGSQAYIKMLNGTFDAEYSTSTVTQIRVGTWCRCGMFIVANDTSNISVETY